MAMSMSLFLIAIPLAQLPNTLMGTLYQSRTNLILSKATTLASWYKLASLAIRSVNSLMSWVIFFYMNSFR